MPSTDTLAPTEPPLGQLVASRPFFAGRRLFVPTFAFAALIGSSAILAGCEVVSERPAAAADTSGARTEAANGYRGVILDPPITRPDFVLTDVNGVPYDFRRETEGRLVLLFIGYTSCPDVCPLHMANIASALEGLPEVRDRVAVIFITADPERDTPERLKSWLGAFDPDFVGLRGTPDQVHEIENGLKLPASVVPAVEDADYAVGHAALVVAFPPGGEGRIGYLSGTLASDYAEDIPKLIAGQWDGT